MKDAKGAVVATGSLGVGAKVADHICRFPLTVKGVPASDFYSIEISHRGSQTYSRQALDSDKWDVELSLGS